MRDTTKKIVAGVALIISGYGVIKAVKAANTSVNVIKKRRFRPSTIERNIVIGSIGTGKTAQLLCPNINTSSVLDPHLEECYRCTCHGVPTSNFKTSENTQEKES